MPTDVIRKVCACFPGSVLRAVTPDNRDPRDPQDPRACPKLAGFVLGEHLSTSRETVPNQAVLYTYFTQKV